MTLSSIPYGHKLTVTSPGVDDTIAPTQSWANAGIVNVTGISASLDLNFGTGTSGSGMQFISNSGTMEATKGGTLTIGCLGSPHTATGTLQNDAGRIIANGGTVALNAAVEQTNGGRIEIEHGGTVSLGSIMSSVTGGQIDINHGTLAMTVFPEFSQPTPPPFPSVDLLGRAILAFQGAYATNISDHFDPSSNTLSVFSGTRQIADIPLVGSYSQSEFKVVDHGTAVAFTPGH